MSQNNHDNKVKEIFPALLSDSDVMTGVGAVVFVRKDRQSGKVFLRQGNVYAVDNPNFKFDLASRLQTSELASAENIAFIRKSRQNLEKLTETILQKELVKSAELTNVLKEYFLGLVDDLLTWDDVNVEWRANESWSGITVPQVSLGKLIDISSNRHQHVIGQAKEWNFSDVKTMISSPYYIIGDVDLNDRSLDHINKAILVEPSRTLRGAAETSAVPLFVLLQALIALEKSGLVSFQEEKAKNTSVTLETVVEQQLETPPVGNRIPTLPGKPSLPVEETKGTKQMTYPTNATPAFDVIGLVKQLKEGLAKQQRDIGASEQKSLDYSQEISSLQAKIATLQISLAAEEAVKKDLKAHQSYALRTVKDLGTND